MNNKFTIAIISAQSAVMLVVFYLLSNEATQALILNQNILLGLAAFAVITLIFAIITMPRRPVPIEEGVRKDGTVKWFNPNKGFGFIEQDSGDDLFVHQSEIRQSGFRYLNKGDRVEFEVGTGRKGPVALSVIRTQAADPEEYPESYEDSETEPVSQAS